MKSSDQIDADRAIRLARHSTQLLGIVPALFGLVMIVAFGYFNRYQRFRPHFINLGLLVWFAPGVTFLASAYYLGLRRRAGAILGIIVALFQSLCAAAILIACCTLPPVSPIPIVMSLLWLAALGQLTLHLQRALRAIDLNTEVRPGFAIPRKVLPVESADSSELKQ